MKKLQLILRDCSANAVTIGCTEDEAYRVLSDYTADSPPEIIRVEGFSGEVAVIEFEYLAGLVINEPPQQDPNQG